IYLSHTHIHTHCLALSLSFSLSLKHTLSVSYTNTHTHTHARTHTHTHLPTHPPSYTLHSLLKAITSFYALTTSYPKHCHWSSPSNKIQIWYNLTHSNALMGALPTPRFLVTNMHC